MVQVEAGYIRNFSYRLFFKALREVTEKSFIDLHPVLSAA